MQKQPQAIKKSNYSLMPYVGGKHLLSKTIIKHINNTPHKQYAEVFYGSAKVFFRKSLSTYEILNDFNSDISNLFLCIKENITELEKELHWLLFSKDHYYYIKEKIKDNNLPNYQKAAYFYFLQKTTFGGRMSHDSFARVYKHNSKFNFKRDIVIIKQAHNRLSRATIDCLDFEDFIAKYDYKDSLFYLDPPYYIAERCYDKQLFSNKDFKRLQACLSNIKGKFILSINDCAEIRELFAGYYTVQEKVNYSINVNNQGLRSELLIFNYKPVVNTKLF